MARIFYSNLVNEITGTIGGLTFQKNLSGTIVRLKPKNKSLHNPAQNTVLNIHSELMKHYRQLSSAHKATWQTLVNSFTYVDKWGDTRVLSAANMYCLAGYPNFIYYNVFFSFAPAHFIITPFDNYTVTLGANSILLNWAVTQSLASQAIQIWATPPLTSVNVIPRSKFRLMLIDQDDTINSYNIGPVWESYFGLSVQNDVINNGKFIMTYCVRDKKFFTSPTLAIVSHN